MTINATTSVRAHTVGEPTLSQRRRSEQGQTTAEYALVLLAAGTVAMLVVAWAQDNNSIGAFFDLVLSKITSLIE